MDILVKNHSSRQRGTLAHHLDLICITSSAPAQGFEVSAVCLHFLPTYGWPAGKQSALWVSLLTLGIFSSPLKAVHSSGSPLKSANSGTRIDELRQRHRNKHSNSPG